MSAVSSHAPAFGGRSSFVTMPLSAVERFAAHAQPGDRRHGPHRHDRFLDPGAARDRTGADQPRPIDGPGATAWTSPSDHWKPGKKSVIVQPNSATAEMRAMRKAGNQEVAVLTFSCFPAFLIWLVRHSAEGLEKIEPA
jgi:hypothetical protein